MAIIKYGDSFFDVPGTPQQVQQKTMIELKIGTIAFWLDVREQQSEGDGACQLLIWASVPFVIYAA